MVIEITKELDRYLSWNFVLKATFAQSIVQETL